ncbi:MAG: hypothetical protein ACREM1_20040 [Longimicrobiales bacterium]
MANLTDCTPIPGPTRLESPARNRYYYGKLLDEHHLELEQRYGNLKRWLVNRLSLGIGVLCGLRVTANADGSRVRVSAGAAVDGLGREIIVPRDSKPIDPAQPTDACGRPAGLPIRRGGTVTLYLCYHECEEEPAPVLVSDCAPENACENGLVRERYLLLIADGVPDAGPGTVTAEQCARIFGPIPAGASRRVIACETLARTCAPPDEHCVALATLELDEAGRVIDIDECGYRPNLYSNAVLLDLILCLAARVDLCCGEVQIRSLAIESGDNQSGTVSALLADPLVARVSEAGGAVANETVTFDIQSGGGAIGDDPTNLGVSFSTTTDATGLATLPHWRLGPAAGPQLVRASIAAGMPAQVIFRAAALEPEIELPVVRAIWPPNAAQLARDAASEELVEWFFRFLRQPHIELTFNHKMADPNLSQPDPWLRVFQLRSFGENEIQVTPLGIGYAGAAPGSTLGVTGFTEVYRVDFSQDALGDALGVRFLVLIRAGNDNIVDTSSPPLMLDAEFGGTTLTENRIGEIWQLTGQQFFPQEVWDALVDTGAVLPHSGDGSEGGQFHSWFGVARTLG